MRGAAAIWVFLYEPVIAVVSAIILYRWFHVTGWGLTVIALLLSAAVGSVAMSAVGLRRARAVMLAFTSALVMGGLFLLWAASVHGSLG